MLWTDSIDTRYNHQSTVALRMHLLFQLEPTQMIRDLLSLLQLILINLHSAKECCCWVCIRSIAQGIRWYRVAGICYESFNFVNFANQKTLAKIKASIYFWINIVQTKCIASN